METRKQKRVQIAGREEPIPPFAAQGVNPSWRDN